MERGLEILVAQSYSKNLGLYSERVGALNVVLQDKETAGKARAWAGRIEGAGMAEQGDAIGKGAAGHSPDGGVLRRC